MRNGLQTYEDLEPGELASINRFDLDDTFWWVWMSSLSAEETTERKAVFGRCTLIETRIRGAKWLVMEEQVKGASPGPEEGAYIAEKKGRFSFRTRLGRRKSTGKKPTPPKEPYNRTTSNTPMSKTSIGPDQHARVQAAAARLAQKERDEKAAEQQSQRRARTDDAVSTKTNSVLTLQPHLLTEAGPAMKWDKRFGEGAKDREALRAHYLGDANLGKGSRDNLLATANGGTSMRSHNISTRDLPAIPQSEVDATSMRRDASPAPAPSAEPPVNGTTLKAEGSSTPVPLRKTISPSALDEKPIPQDDQLDTHPALRKPIPERKPVAPVKQESSAPVEEEPVPAPAPEPTKKSPPKKLKKKDGGGGGGGGGFRKLFGKKKAENPAPPPPKEPAQPVVSVPYEQQQVESGRHTPLPEKNHTPPREPSLRAPSPPVEQSKSISAVSHDYREPTYPAPSNSSVQEQQEAKQAFARFDQGPMDDMPAFVPDEDSDDDLAAPNVPRHPTQSSHAQDAVTPTQQTFKDDVSEDSVELTRQASPSQDRWAQIRKNAAERAARLSEEQSRRSQSQSARTDEGETSGEETIESRVARIKARVAELTGNMEGGPQAGQR
jgi:hypothetical protein